MTETAPPADRSITGRTRIAGVVGSPVEHSRSPAIHNAAFAALGLDWVYGAFPVAPEAGPSLVEAMRTLGLAGLSVTMPHKQAAARGADRRTEVVDRLGVANTLFRDGDVIVADSTDGDGFVSAFEHELNLESGRGFDRSVVAVLGAGGAARAIIEALGRTGAERILVVNRSPDKAVAAAELAPNAEAALVDEVAEADIVVNATAVGMDGGPAPGSIPVPPRVLVRARVVADIVYQPRVTPLLATAADHGAVTVGGLGMLVHQAALQFRRWTGVPAPLDVMSRAVDPAAT